VEFSNVSTKIALSQEKLKILVWKMDQPLSVRVNFSEQANAVSLSFHYNI
jgi:hypothetical protein